MQIIGIGRNFIRGGVECNIHCDRGDLHYMTDCMNINEVSRVKYWGGGGGGGGAGRLQFLRLCRYGSQNVMCTDHIPK